MTKATDTTVAGLTRTDRMRRERRAACTLCFGAICGVTLLLAPTAVAAETASTSLSLRTGLLSTAAHVQMTSTLRTGLARPADLLVRRPGAAASVSHASATEPQSESTVPASLRLARISAPAPDGRAGLLAWALKETGAATTAGCAASDAPAKAPGMLMAKAAKPEPPKTVTTIAAFRIPANRAELPAFAALQDATPAAYETAAMCRSNARTAGIDLVDAGKADAQAQWSARFAAISLPAAQSPVTVASLTAASWTKDAMQTAQQSVRLASLPMPAPRPRALLAEAEEMPVPLPTPVQLAARSPAEETGVSWDPKRAVHGTDPDLAAQRRARLQSAALLDEPVVTPAPSTQVAQVPDLATMDVPAIIALEGEADVPAKAATKVGDTVRPEPPAWIAGRAAVSVGLGDTPERVDLPILSRAEAVPTTGGTVQGEDARQATIVDRNPGEDPMLAARRLHTDGMPRETRTARPAESYPVVDVSRPGWAAMRPAQMTSPLPPPASGALPRGQTPGFEGRPAVRVEPEVPPQSDAPVYGTLSDDDSPASLLVPLSDDPYAVTRAAQQRQTQTQTAALPPQQNTSARGPVPSELRIVYEPWRNGVSPHALRWLRTMADKAQDERGTRVELRVAQAWSLSAPERQRLSQRIATIRSVLAARGVSPAMVQVVQSDREADAVVVRLLPGKELRPVDAPSRPLLTW